MIFAISSLPSQCIQVIEKITKMREELTWATSDRLHRWTGLLARISYARAIHASNAMEGINASLEDAVNAVDGREMIDPKDENQLALHGFWQAMTYIVQLSKDPSYVHNDGTIKGLHYMMTQYDLTVNPGRWRTGGIHVTNTKTKQIVYEGPPADLVPPLMTELIGVLNQPNELPGIVRAAMAHLNLTMIHPFSDGNGRMARALQTMVLSREGILSPEFSSIEEYIGNHTQDYYAVLAEVGRGSWNPHHDPMPWIRFCLTAHFRQANTLLRRVTEMGRLWAALESELSDRRLNERMAAALADAALGIKVKNPNYAEQVGISGEVGKKDLKALMDVGLLIPRGERRGRHYIASDLVRKIRDSVRLPRIEPDPFEETPAQEELPGLSAPRAA